MKTEKIHYLNSQPTFSAGKVRVFSDFDRTFLPASHKEFVSFDKRKVVTLIRDSFKSFTEFLKNTKDSLKFTITTGRTFGEFLTMAEFAREGRVKMPLPDTLIVKNGSDEHIKVGTDEDFYKGGEFPFKYEVTNKEKEKDIKQLSGWDGSVVKKIINEVFTSNKLDSIEADSEHSIRDYGERSLLSHAHSSNRYTIGLRKDGNLKAFISFPEKLLNDSDEKVNVAEIQQQIYSKLQEKGIKFEQPYNKPNHEKIYSVYEPRISETGSIKNLTKLYDTKEAVKLASKNNDLVIVAGDGLNDAEMINPGLYLKEYIPEKLLEKEENKDLLTQIENPQTLIEELDKNPELAKIFKEMPFVGVVIKQENGVNELKEFEPFIEGKYKKLIIVNQGELELGIKEAIKMYSDENPKYAEKLASDLKTEITKTPKKSEIKQNDTDEKKTPIKQEDNNLNNNETQGNNKPEENTGSDGNNDNGGNGGNGGDDNPKSNLWKYIVGGLAVVGIGSGVYYVHRKNKKAQ